MRQKDSHCSYCGRPFADGAAWPRTCAGCDSVSYKNPLPVAVLLLPVDGGLLTVRRGIPPQIGKLSLPGGFIDFGETWQEAAVRELSEETNVVVPADEVEEFRVRSSPGGHLLVFGIARPRRSEELPPFVPNEESTERVVLAGPTELAFPLHTEAARLFFERPSSPSARR
jgi:ADP-ribose pyrophosphatase YjhB (NUDIX family)